MLDTLRHQLRELYQAARRSYANVVAVETDQLEETIQWDAAWTKFARSDEATNNITFNETPPRLNSHCVVNKVNFASDSQLRFFVDGAQHTRPLFIADIIPIYFTISGVGIMERVRPGGPLARWIVEPQVRGSLLMPNTSLTAPLWNFCRAHNIPVEDTIASLQTNSPKIRPEEVVSDFKLSRYFAYERAREIRQSLEREAIRTWTQSDHSGWLLTDGDTRHLGPIDEGRPVVGVIKSHRYQYFNGASQKMLLHLPVFHRTNSFTFQYSLALGRPRSSFYLRWRSPDDQPEPDYGLLRIETSLEPSQFDFDKLARWIIAESRPPQFDRNGNHLYPIARSERAAKHLIQDYAHHLPRRWLTSSI